MFRLEGSNGGFTPLYGMSGPSSIQTKRAAKTRVPIAWAAGIHGIRYAAVIYPRTIDDKGATATVERK
jgi:hypothetical protein